MPANPSSGLRLYVGGSVDLDLIQQARARFEDAQRHEHYRVSGGTKHLLEVLEDEENFTKVVVDSWLNVRSQRTLVFAVADFV